MTSLSTLILVLVSVGLTLSQEMYSSKYDNTDVDLILRNERLLKRYMACALDEGPCTQEGRYFRTILPDALATNCEKCTDKMKNNVRKISNHMMKNRPEDWAIFVKKYDADGKYRESFARFLKE